MPKKISTSYKEMVKTYNDSVISIHRAALKTKAIYHYQHCYNPDDFNKLRFSYEGLVEVYAKTLRKKNKGLRWFYKSTAESRYPDQFNPDDFPTLPKVKRDKVSYVNLVEKHNKSKNIKKRASYKFKAKKCCTEYNENDFNYIYDSPKAKRTYQKRRRTYRQLLHDFNTSDINIVRCHAKKRAQQWYPDKYKKEDWVTRNMGNKNHLQPVQAYTQNSAKSYPSITTAAKTFPGKMETARVNIFRALAENKIVYGYKWRRI